MRVQALYECKLLAECIDPKVTAFGRITLGVYGAAVRVHTFPDLKRPQLLDIEIAHVETSVITFPARIPLGNVGDPVEIDVVEHDERVIATRNDVLFEVIGAHVVRQSFGRQRVFRQIARRATVRNDQWRHLIRFLESWYNLLIILSLHRHQSPENR